MFLFDILANYPNAPTKLESTQPNLLAYHFHKNQGIFTKQLLKRSVK